MASRKHRNDACGRAAGTVARVKIRRLLGRPVRCSECGRTLFRGFAFVWRGKVRVLGAGEQTIRVSFDTQNTVHFRHVHLEQCPTPDRPWVARS
jgi:hypothetical protein